MNGNGATGNGATGNGATGDEWHSPGPQPAISIYATYLGGDQKQLWVREVTVTIPIDGITPTDYTPIVRATINELGRIPGDHAYRTSLHTPGAVLRVDAASTLGETVGR